MFEFLRRIPEFLRLARKPKPEPPRLRVVGGAEVGSAKPSRGRGTGRGITPPSPPKPKKLRRGKR